MFIIENFLLIFKINIYLNLSFFDLCIVIRLIVFCGNVILIFVKLFLFFKILLII